MKSPLNLTIKCTECSIWRHKTTCENYGAVCGCVCMRAHMFLFFLFFCDMQAEDVHSPTPIICVTHLNICNSKDTMAAKVGIEWAASPCWNCLFSGFASLPGV